MNDDKKIELNEQLITAWVKLTGILKNTRITQGMIYNEAIVMMLCYNRYREDGEGLISFREIVVETRMLKPHDRFACEKVAIGAARRNGQTHLVCAPRKRKSRRIFESARTIACASRRNTFRYRERRRGSIRPSRRKNRRK